MYACVTRPVRVCHVTWLVGIHKRDDYLDELTPVSQITASHATNMDESCRTYERIMFHVLVCHVNHFGHTHGWVMAHVLMPHMWMSLTRIRPLTSHNSKCVESCYTCEWFMSHEWTNHVTHVNDSCHTCQWVMSKICVCHATHIYASYCTPKWVLSRTCNCLFTHMNVSWMYIEHILYTCI